MNIKESAENLGLEEEEYLELIELFIETGITDLANLQSAVEKERIQEADKRGRILQVGHLERFNSGLITLSPMIENPIYIESQRLSPFLGRGIDVDVTIDLMVHDIDIILSLVNSEITDLKAQGIKVLTDNIDLAHAWVEFKNGCVAVISANRISSNKMRNLKVFQHNAFIELDYINHEVSYYERHKKTVERQIIKAENPTILITPICRRENLPSLRIGGGVIVGSTSNSCNTFNASCKR